jgi:hypothetical protein
MYNINMCKNKHLKLNKPQPSTTMLGLKGQTIKVNEIFSLLWPGTHYVGLADNKHNQGFYFTTN